MSTAISCPRCNSTYPLSANDANIPALCYRCGQPLQGDGLLPPRAGDGEEPNRPVTLQGVDVAWINQFLPARPRDYLLVVGAIAVACWVAGYLLAPDTAAFLASHEWQAQPFFLAVHFVTLRLFISVYVTNYLAGTARLDLAAGDALKQVRWVLGPRSMAAAVVVALPFCVKDFLILHGDKYARDSALGPGQTLSAADYFMGAIWSVEWLLNAYIWVLLSGFLYVTMRTLRKHTFREPVEVVLNDKHYRPFLMMSSQGASILLAFAAVDGAYIWYTEGEITDYIGLGITVALLFFNFVPPWMKIKAMVEGRIKAEMQRLRESTAVCARRHDEAAARPEVALEARLDEVLGMLHIVYLDRLHQNLGKAEGTALLLKLLAPASTIVWKFGRSFLGF